MSEKFYTVIRKQIIKAANMAHARNLAEGYDDFPGEVLLEEIDSNITDQSLG
jgi:hypothetical protein